MWALRRLPVSLARRGNRMNLQKRFNQTDSVLYERNANSLTITLNRPQALNALNLDMVRFLSPLYTQWETDGKISNIVMKGQGTKAFCAGGDIVQICESGKQGTSLSYDFFREEYILNHIIGTLNTPHIAILNGITMGGGVGLSVHGKFRVATETTLFAMPETAIGFFPDVGGSYFLPRLEGSLGMFLGLTGYRLKGKQVLAAGIATHFIPQASLAQVEQELSQLDSKDPKGVEAVLNKYSEPAELKDTELGQNWSLINRVFGAPTVEDIMRGLADDGSEFAAKQLATMKKMSPTALKVTQRQLQKGKNMTFEEALDMELTLSQHFMKGTDFYEGVTELLITKTNQPNWFPATLQEIPEEQVQKYFEKSNNHDLKSELHFAKSKNDAKL